MPILLYQKRSCQIIALNPPTPLFFPPLINFLISASQNLWCYIYKYQIFWLNFYYWWTLIYGTVSNILEFFRRLPFNILGVFQIFRNILAAMHMGNECLNISTLIVFTNMFMCHPKYAMHTTYISITSGMHYIFWIAHFGPDFIHWQSLTFEHCMS